MSDVPVAAPSGPPAGGARPRADRPQSTPPPPPPEVRAIKGDPVKPTSPVAFEPIGSGSGQRVVLYGPGGVGKTSAAACAPGPVVFFDLDDSLPKLKGQLAESPHPELIRVSPARTWKALREALMAPGWEAVKTIVIDSATKAEELAAEWTCMNVPSDGNKTVRRIQDYPYGKGYEHLFDTFLLLLGDLDQHARAGRNVVMICHECTATVPNPAGENWLRYEPRLQQTKNGAASIRLRLKEWADHVLFIGYDVAVDKGKASGGKRIVQPQEQPYCMAKSRCLGGRLELTKYDPDLWAYLFGEKHYVPSNP